MPPTLDIRLNPNLKGETIVASLDTAKELRQVLSGCGIVVGSNSTYDDNCVSVSPALYDDFTAFLRCYQNVLHRAGA